MEVEFYVVRESYTVKYLEQGEGKMPQTETTGQNTKSEMQFTLVQFVVKSVSRDGSIVGVERTSYQQGESFTDAVQKLTVATKAMHLHIGLFDRVPRPGEIIALPIGRPVMKQFEGIEGAI